MLLIESRQVLPHHEDVDAIEDALAKDGSMAVSQVKIAADQR